MPVKLGYHRPENLMQLVTITEAAMTNAPRVALTINKLTELFISLRHDPKFLGMITPILTRVKKTEHACVFPEDGSIFLTQIPEVLRHLLEAVEENVIASSLDDLSIYCQTSPISGFLIE